TIKPNTRSPWKIYVHVPRDRPGITSEKPYGTLEIADMPLPEYSISTTPKLFIITAAARTGSPQRTGRFVFDSSFIFSSRSPFLPQAFPHSGFQLTRLFYRQFTPITVK